MQRKLLIISTFLLIGLCACASASFVETALRQNVGVRAMGMGGAFTGVADDTSSGFYNPAGISGSGFQYYLENSDYKNQLLARSDNSFLQWQSLIYSDWHHRDKAGNLVDVSAISYGQQGASSWGFTYKRVASNLDSNGYSVDFGLLMDLGQTIKFGFLAQDLFKENVSVRTALRGGLSFRVLGNKLLCAVDEEFYRGPEPKFIMHYGAEYNLTEALDVRTGWADGNFTGGISLLFDFGTLEYAIATGVDLDREAKHSIAVNFGRKREIPALSQEGNTSARQGRLPIRQFFGKHR